MTAFFQTPIYLPNLDFHPLSCYNPLNFIGQFVTILSVNKTRELDGRFALIFCWVGAYCAHFL